MTNLRPAELSTTQRLPEFVLDTILSWQLIVAWAGEGLCVPIRLNWWRTDLIDQDGGGDFFQRLLPKTHVWASLEALRQVAIQYDQQIRLGMAQPDLVRTLFFWGFAIDEQLADRLAVHKQNHLPPQDCLDLPLGLDVAFSRSDLEAVLRISDQALQVRVVPDGREITGEMPQSHKQRVRNLAAALLPLNERYPMPFYRVAVTHAS